MLSNKEQYLTQCSTSFVLWLDNRIANVGEGYVNHSGQLYPAPDPRFEGKNVYGSPYRQWIGDTSVVGADVPSGVYQGNVFVPRGTSGVSMDFQRGRIMSNAALTNVTCRYALKEFNIYYSDAAEEELLFARSYPLVNTTNTVFRALEYNAKAYPCIFVKNTFSQNFPHAMGGMDDSQTSMRCIVLADNVGSLDSVISLMADSAQSCFPIIPNSGTPFNAFGDWKNGEYNYSALTEVYKNNLAFIDSVQVTRFNEATNKLIANKSIGAFVDFLVHSYRYPRRSL